MPLDHVAYSVQFSKFDDEVAFLLGALKHMGYKQYVAPFPGLAGLGDDKPWLWIAGIENRQPIGDDVKVTKTHLALSATDRSQVDTFHTEALKAGATDNGEPGIRDYHPNYYGAFVISPGGHNIECVVHTPPN